MGREKGAGLGSTLVVGAGAVGVLDWDRGPGLEGVLEGGNGGVADSVHTRVAHEVPLVADVEAKWDKNWVKGH